MDDAPPVVDGFTNLSVFDFSGVVYNDSSMDEDYSPVAPPSLQYLSIIRLGIALTYGVLFVLGLANFLCIVAISRVAKLKQSVTNIYIMNLSLADALYVIWIPFIVTMLFRKSWLFGVPMCKLYLIAESMNKYASVVLLTVLSIDRYLAICQPVRSLIYRTPKAALLVCLVCWLCVAALMTPLYIYARHVELAPGIYGCYVVWQQADNDTDSGQRAPVEVQFTLYSFAFVFLLPLLLVICFYGLVLARLRRLSKKNLRGNSLKSRQTNDSNYRRVTRMILAVIVCHVCCWTPFWVMNLIVSVGSGTELSLWKQVLFNFIHMTPYLNSALNPVLYGLLNHNFRDAFMEMLCCVPAGWRKEALERRISNSFETHSRCPSRSVHRLSGNSEFISNFRTSASFMTGLMNGMATTASLQHQHDYTAMLLQQKTNDNSRQHCIATATAADDGCCSDEAEPLQL